MQDEIIIAGASPALETAVKWLSMGSYRVHREKHPPSVFDRPRESIFPVIIAEYGRRDFESWMMRYVRESIPALVILLVEDDELESAAAQWKNHVAEFVCKPLRRLLLEIAVEHAFDRFRLTRAASERIPGEGVAREETAERIDTERFLVAQQIVDKLHAFLTRIAAGVQGGVRYFNELPYFVSIHSRNQRVLAANRTYLKYLGNRISKNSWEIYVGRRESPESGPVGKTLRSAAVQSTRALVKYQSGARVPVEVHTAPIYNNDGDIDLVIEVFAGTKEIERMSREIGATQQRYEQLFDAVPSKVVVMDRRFRISAVNRSFRNAFGDCIGEQFFDVLRPGSFPAHRDPVSRTVREGIPQEGEMVLTDRQGVKYNMMAWTSPITTGTGKLIQVLVIFADVTELRTLQDNLSSLGMMVSTISHDIKGSLTGLDTGLYLIDKGFYRNKPGRIEEGLDVAKLMVERIRKLAMGVLYSAKEREIEPEQVDLNPFAEDVAANVRTLILSADVHFDCRIPDGLGTAEMDPKLFRSALINLLENAVEACVEDNTAKDFEILFSVTAENDHIIFEIADNGSGMTLESRSKAFALFYSSKGARGTGLGLYITRNVVKKHGGSITFDSNPGEGSRFRIRLPRRITGVLRAMPK